MVAVDGFSSWGEEEDMDTDMHSPTDASEDSVDVKVKPIPSLKSKRKCTEPRKFSDEVKKRRVDSKELPESPFRPWSEKTPSGYVPRGYPLPAADQDEPLSLVLRDKRPEDVSERPVPPPHIHSHAKSMPRPLVPPHSLLERLNTPANSTSRPRPQDVVRLHHYVEKPSSVRSETDSYHLEDSNDRSRAFSVESLMSESNRAAPSTSTSSALDKKLPATVVQQQQRNYKNMTRERRVEANARERTRVHTISAAFDTLRRAVPAYSHNQKLSKLSVLRIACSYILTLSRVAGLDYSEDSSEPPLADCVDHVTSTIQLEGKLRKKKDD